MHEAYTSHPPASISVQIESMAAFGSQVILGTRQGHMLIYSVNRNDYDNKMELQLLQYDKNFSKKPITQIEVVPDNILFSLSDCINVSDISHMNFTLLHSAPKTKGCSIFCLNAQHSKTMTGETKVVLRMCSALKRKLQFWYWKHDQLLQFREPIELTDTPKALSWTQDVICIGFKTEYILYNISHDPEKTDLFPTSSSRTIEPVICRISNDVFALVKDEFLVAVDAAKVAQKSLETSKGGVASVGAASGSIKPATKNDELALLMDEKRKLFKPIIWSEPIKVLVWDEPYIIGLVSTGLEVRSLNTDVSNKDTLVQTFPELFKARLIANSRKGLIFVASYSQLWYLQSVDISKQRQSLLQQKKFQLALQLTNISNESEAEKAETINFINTRYAFDLFSSKQFSKAMDVFIQLSTDPCDVIRLFPDLLPEGSKTAPKSSPTPANLPVLEDKDLENGLQALIDYLTGVRMKPTDTGKKSPLLSIIDTTLLKCYLQTNDSLVASVLRLNNCHLEESEKTLIKYQKYEELIILYQTKGQHKKALELLKSQAKKPDSVHFGHERTVKYLQDLGSEHKDLLLEFADWVLRDHPEDGLKIFIDILPETEAVPRAEVLDFLLKNHKNLVIPYLEHIIHVWNEPKPIFHNILIQQYRERVQALLAEVKNDDGMEGQKKIKLENMRSKLIDFLQKSDKYNPESVLSDFPYNDLFDERAMILGKLGKHEKVLAIYIQILGDIEKACKYCEKVCTNNPDVFALLIKTMSIPPSSPPYGGVQLHPNCQKPDFETILKILNTYTSKINPIHVLPYLPGDMPLERLKFYLETVLRSQLERRRKNQVLKGLLYAEDLQLQEQRMRYESKSFTISEISTCPICKKRFTNQSAFVRLPDGELVHYSCHKSIES